MTIDLNELTEEEKNLPFLDHPEGFDYLTLVMRGIESQWNLARIQPAHFSPLHYEIWYEKLKHWGITWNEIRRAVTVILSRQPFKESFPTIDEILDMVRPHRYEAPIEPRPEVDPESLERRKERIAAARQQLKSAISRHMKDDDE